MARSFKRQRHRRPQTSAPLPVVELAVERISHDIRGIAYWQDKPVFISGALAGETVRARFTRNNARFAEARAEAIIVASEQRITPVCAHFGECGGCQLQYMSAAEQLGLKQNAVLDQLQRQGGIVPEQILPTISLADTGYRSQARLGVWVSEQQTTLGFRRFNDRELTAISHCPVLVAPLNDLLVPLRKLLSENASKSITHIAITETDGQCALVLRHTQTLAQPVLAALSDFASRYHCDLWLQPNKDPYALTDLDGRAVNPRMHYTLAEFDCTLALHPADFIQINSAVNRAMVTQALDLLGPTADEHVLDLFCGIGNFTLPLARRAGRVTGVEALESMVARGRENALVNGLSNVDFMAADLNVTDAADLIKRIGPVDALLLDPPRDGAREVCENIQRLSPARVVYVSCNPATLARDAASLVGKGYRLHTFGVLDMFPHTSHVESMALFIRT
ncbi:MAG TPA: 23S rRNA (uracil(1939)-C(5))-methyltransferase RlmD [Cellvibrionaceae bacterium]